MASEGAMSELPRRRPRRAATRKEARANQRWRVLEAMAHQVGKNGYARTTVADVIARAGVSRKAFYEYFTEKEDCFLVAYEELSARLVNDLVAEGVPYGRGDRAAAQLARYLSVLASDLLMARAFVVEVMAAGPRSLELREEVNRRFAELVFGHTSADPLVRKALIGGVNDLVTGALLRGEKDLVKLLPSMKRFVNRR